MKKALQNFSAFVLQHLVHRDRTCYHDDFFGTVNPLILFFKNLLKPDRRLQKFFYGQIVPVPQFLSRAKPVNPRELVREADPIVATLRQEGIAIVHGHYQEKADEIIKLYRIAEDNFTASPDYMAQFMSPHDLPVYAIMTDPLILSVCARYFRCQPFYRYYPRKAIVFSDRDDFASLNRRFHFDTVNQLSVMIFLSDWRRHHTRMIFAKRSHKRHHISLNDYDYFASESLMRKKYELMDCIGPKGTALFFDPNGYHRLEFVKNSFRAHMLLNATPGNDIRPRDKLPQRDGGRDLRLGTSPHHQPDKLLSLQKNALAFLP